MELLRNRPLDTTGTPIAIASISATGMPSLSPFAAMTHVSTKTSVVRLTWMGLTASHRNHAVWIVTRSCHALERKLNMVQLWTGVTAAAGVIQVLQQLNLHARRSIRFVAWTDNEAELRGA